MNTLFAMLMGLFTASSSAQTVPKMHFTYEPNEMELSSCTHEQIQDLPDWRVACQTPYGMKTFTAHVIVRDYPKGETTGVEILYWVTEPGDTPTSPSIFHTTSALLNVKGANPLVGFSLSQGVESDYASLVLGWESGNP